MASATFEFDQELQFMNSIDLGDIGHFAIEANNDDGMFWYLIIRTSMGTSSIATCGPVVPDVDMLPDGFSQHLYRMPFKEDKICKQISFFLNDRTKKITKAVEVDINEAISQFRDLKSYLEDWDEGKY